MVGNVSDAHTSLGRDNRTLGGPGAASSSLSTFTVEENEHNSHHQPNHAPQMYKLSQIYESSGMTTVKNEEYDSVSQSSGDDLADGNDSDFEEHHQRPPLISEKFSFEMPPMAPTTSGESGTKSAAALHHERKLEEELKKRTGNPSISCVNCETNHTPLWRRDAEGALFSDPQSLERPSSPLPHSNSRHSFPFRPSTMQRMWPISETSRYGAAKRHVGRSAPSQPKTERGCCRC